MIEKGEYKGNPIIILKRNEKDKFPMSFGVGKARLILENIEEIIKFLETGKNQSILNSKQKFFDQPIKEPHSYSAPMKDDKLNEDLLSFDASKSKIISESIKKDTVIKKTAEKTYIIDSVIGESEQIKIIKKTILKIAQTKLPVLISGECGTEKEIVARVIHSYSSISKAPIVCIHCTEFNNDHMAKLLKYKSATLLLDEVGEIDSQTQSRLYSAIETIRVKENKSNETNIRLISTTAVDIEKSVKEGKFKKELFYRLNKLHLSLPPLRERKEDIPLFVKYFTEKYSQKGQVLDSSAMNAMMNYEWPGNISELENCIERLVFLCEDRMIKIEDLPNEIKKTLQKQEIESKKLKDITRQKEKEAIMKIMDEVGGDRKEAARILNINLATLYRKLKNYANLDK